MFYESTISKLNTPRLFLWTFQFPVTRERVRILFVIVVLAGRTGIYPIRIIVFYLFTQYTLYSVCRLLIYVRYSDIRISMFVNVFRKTLLLLSRLEMVLITQSDVSRRMSIMIGKELINFYLHFIWRSESEI